MTYQVENPASKSHGLRRSARNIALLLCAASLVVACRPGGDDGRPQVAGWALIDPAERHPILVSQRPVSMSIPVRRGSYGMSNGARHRVAGFLHKFRATDTGNSKLIISAPSGGANDVAGMQVVAEVRDMIAEAGFPPSSVHVEASAGLHHVRISYLQVVAKGPECGLWPTNLARDPANVAYPNFGCATQRNLAEMVANPADLLGPRTLTPRMGDRRQKTYENYVKGETTTAKKSKDERISTQKSE